VSESRECPGRKQFDVDEVLEKAMRAFWKPGLRGHVHAALVKRIGINRGSHCY
jgi:hypothetical protein